MRFDNCRLLYYHFSPKKILHNIFGLSFPQLPLGKKRVEISFITVVLVHMHQKLLHRLESAVHIAVLSKILQMFLNLEQHLSKLD